MYNKKFTFPDIQSARNKIDQEEIDDIIEKMNHNQYDKHFMAKCKIDIPTDLFMTPLPEKSRKDGCMYKCGVIDGYYNDVDITEAIKVGGKLLEIEKGNIIVFDHNLEENDFHEFIKKLYEFRM
jgi:hypothetical protein